MAITLKELKLLIQKWEAQGAKDSSSIYMYDAFADKYPFEIENSEVIGEEAPHNPPIIMIEVPG